MFVALQGFERRQGFSAQQGKEGASSQREVRKAMLNSGTLQRGERVAAACDRAQETAFRLRCQEAQQTQGGNIARRTLDDADRSVDDDARAMRRSIEQPFDGTAALATDISDRSLDTPVQQHFYAFLLLAFGNTSAIDRQQEKAAFFVFLELLLESTRSLQFFLVEGIERKGAARGEKAVRHRATEADGRTAMHERKQEVDFCRDLASAEDGDASLRRVCRVFLRLQQGEQGFKFLCQRRTCVGWQQACDGAGGGVCAVADGEGIVDIEIGVRLQGGSEGGVVLFFAYVKAEVFEES